MRRTFLLISAVAAGASLTACGSSPHGTKAAASKSTQSAATTNANLTQGGPGRAGNVLLPEGAAAQKPVAIIAGKSLSGAEFEHWIVLTRGGAPLGDKPDYAKCIASVKGQAEKSSGQRISSEAEARRICTARFEEERAVDGLGAAIHTRWLLGEAAEEKIHISDAEVQQGVAATEKFFGTRAKFESHLKAVGQSLEDLKAEVRVNKMADVIFKRIEEKAHALAAGQVTHYYAEHAKQFTTPAGRAVRIVRTASAASAAKVKQELLAGKSFAQAAKELSAIGQPVTAKNGEVADLQQGFFQQQALDSAIFSAKPGQIYGPIKVTARHKTIAPETNSGYFIFEVHAIVPAQKTPLSKVRAQLTAQLTQQQKLRELGAFIKAFRAKWLARSDCLPGYVLTRFCRQYKRKAGEPEDPYAL